jgi:hypothetical protein
VQTFYAPLFNNSPSAIHFPSEIPFHSKASHIKKPYFIQKPKAKSLPFQKTKRTKAKGLLSSFSEPFIASGKQGAAVVKEGMTL